MLQMMTSKTSAQMRPQLTLVTHYQTVSKRQMASGARMVVLIMVSATRL